ncbi:hypothetical protein H6G06_00900 [Anabaena sphaerica FACHB-251]|uniref:Uncharacterized protein n=1 Tax=Anabaena sphaerica FACHB-251 TaxID=2692883 RepID=A0A926ZY11_9NOST|nr:hypothetical protein [Anabaena sphaerica]MBD2292072.1 hypothetical protein [Anabaena sphaerica FACHB-251]
MNELQQILNERREKLVEDIIVLSRDKIDTLDIILTSTQFFQYSIERTEVNLSEQSPVDNYNIDNLSATAFLILDKFVEFNDSELHRISFPEHKNLFAFIYHQLFISIIANLDDYFSQLLLLILQAYPEKLGEKKIFQVKFNDVITLLGTGKDKIIIRSMDEQIVSNVRTLMQKNLLIILPNFLNI